MFTISCKQGKTQKPAGADNQSAPSILRTTRTVIVPLIFCTVTAAANT